MGLGLHGIDPRKVRVRRHGYEDATVGGRGRSVAEIWLEPSGDVAGGRVARWQGHMLSSRCRQSGEYGLGRSVMNYPQANPCAGGSWVQGTPPAKLRSPLARSPLSTASLTSQQQISSIAQQLQAITTDCQRCGRGADRTGSNEGTLDLPEAAHAAVLDASSAPNRHRSSLNRLLAHSRHALSRDGCGCRDGQSSAMSRQRTVNSLVLSPRASQVETNPSSAEPAVRRVRWGT